jgi:pimeloyl-ACP methyl ester carboxylesterase
MSNDSILVDINSKKFKLGFKVIGSGQPLILIHGIPGSSKCWDSAARLLANQYKVIVPDLIGFGESSRSENINDLWAPAQASAIAQLLNHLVIKKLVVVGHDYGGPISLTLHSTHPHLFEKLILISTNAFANTPIPFPLSGLFLPLVGQLWGKLLFSRPSLGMMVKGGFKAKDRRPILQEYLGDRSQSKAIAIIFESALRELTARYSPIEKSLKSVGIPTKVIWGDKDPFFTVQQGARTAAACNGQFTLVEGAGHFIPDENPKRIVEEIRSFAQS